MSIKMVDDLPKNAKNAPGKKNGAGSFLLKLKPTVENNVYRFRLLSFVTGNNSRDWPFIEKFVHEKWEKGTDGKNTYKGFVTCPATKYVRPTLPPKSNPFEICPICKYTNSNYLAYKESNYKDKLAGKATREHKRKYVALVPVYVVKDPHEPANINKARVWVIKDKEIYDKLNALVKKQQSKTKVFNGGEAVDLLVYVKSEEVIVAEGQPYEFKRTDIKIDKFGFGKQAYKIDNINDKFIEDFPFDEEFYTFSTAEELQKYYEDNVIANSSIPEDGIDTDELSEEIQTSSEKKTDDKDSIIEDDSTAPITQDEIIDKDLSDIDSLINETIEDEKLNKTENKPQLTDKIPSNKKTDLDDIDNIIDDIIGS